MEKIYGVVDIGTLKVKTEIAAVAQSGAMRRRYASNTLTRFGVGMDENNGFAQEKHIAATIKELKRVKEELDKHHVADFRVVSTHAMRRAKNKDEIINRIKREAGFEVENISQAQEAELFFRAVMSTFAPVAQEYAVVDVGGGSVQILKGTKYKLRRTHMMKTGTVSLHDKFIRNPRDPESYTTRQDIENMKQEILTQLMPFERAKGVPLVYGSTMVIDIMKQMHIPLEAHSHSLAHPYKTYATHLAKVIDDIWPIPFGERDEYYKLPQSYAWGLDKAFLNVTAIAAHFGSPYIIPSNANIAQGIIYAMAKL